MIILIPPLEKELFWFARSGNKTEYGIEFKSRKYTLYPVAEHARKNREGRLTLNYAVLSEISLALKKESSNVI